MGADWHAIEDAFYDWLHEATGLPVVWRYQDAAQPSGDYADLFMEPPTRVGAFDYVRPFTDLNRAAGQEVELRVLAERSVQLQVQLYTQDKVGPNAAHRRLSDAILKLSLPSRQATFNALGVSVFYVGDAQYIPVLNEADFQGRATSTVRFYVRDSVSEFAGYIEKAEVSGTFHP